MKFSAIRVYLFNYCCYEKFNSFQLNKTSKKKFGKFSGDFHIHFFNFVLTYLIY